MLKLNWKKEQHKSLLISVRGVGMETTPWLYWDPTGYYRVPSAEGKRTKKRTAIWKRPTKRTHSSFSKLRGLHFEVSVSILLRLGPQSGKLTSLSNLPNTEIANVEYSFLLADTQMCQSADILWIFELAWDCRECRPCRTEKYLF